MFLHRLLKHINKKTSYRKCRFYSDSVRTTSITDKIKNGPGLKEFIAGSSEPIFAERPHIPYLPDDADFITKRKIFFDVYGCQMNLNDTEIVWSILKKEGFEKTEVEEEADIFLVMTCAIREGAETKIWNRLDHLRGYKRRGLAKNKSVKIGILGCMAERLKEELIEKEKAVDVVAGPDSYRDLPRLLALTDNGQAAVNVLLSLDETYADVVPVRLNQDSVSAFISIMRGCDNMCSYCIVPRTRGRERSRPITAILNEVRELSARGVKEITLLGQNVNSYRDVGEPGSYDAKAKGFKTVYKAKKGGLRFGELLEQVSAVDPEMRVRFTAAHPKDFPDEVLQVISERPNITKLLHLPAQSGNTDVLQRMRRGYSREAYVDLVRTIKEAIPGVGLSTDMICGFCGETDQQFEDTLSLMKLVEYNIAFLFPYSMREKTTAHRRYTDDIPDQVKKDRHNRMIQLYRRISNKLNEAEIGNTHLVLVEGSTKTGQLYGRNEIYIKVVLDQPFCSDHQKVQSESDQNSFIYESKSDENYFMNVNEIKRGDYIAVRIVGAKSSVLNGIPLYRTTLSDFYRDQTWGDRMKYKMTSDTPLLRSGCHYI